MAIRDQDHAAATDIPDAFVISDVPTLKAMAEPIRMAMLNALDEGPATVKEMARRLDVPPTRLYYHVKILERHGLLRVSSKRMVSGIEERSYAATARSWTVADSLLTDPAVSDLLEASFDLTRTEVGIALARGAVPGDPKGPVPMLTFTHWYLTLDQAETMQRKLIELLEEYGALRPRPGAIEYHGVFAAYQVGNVPTSGDGNAS